MTTQVRLQIKNSSWANDWEIDEMYYGVSGYHEALAKFEKAMDEGKVAVLSAPDQNRY